MNAWLGGGCAGLVVVMALDGLDVAAIALVVGKSTVFNFVLVLRGDRRRDTLIFVYHPRFALFLSHRLSNFGQ